MELDKKKKSIFLGICAVVVIAVAAMAMFPRSKSRTPAETFVYVQKRALVDTITQVLTDMAKTENETGFSDDITFLVEEQGMEMEMVMKVDIEPDGKSGVCGITYGMQGISIDFATLTFDEEQFGFYIPLLDSNYYVFDWESFQLLWEELMAEEQIPDLGIYPEEDMESDTGQDLGTDMGQNQEKSQNVSLEPYIFMWKGDLAQFATLWSKYSDIFFSVIKDENVTEEQVSLVINEQQKMCTRYTFQPTAQDLEDMFTELLTTLKTDEVVKELLWGLGTMTWEDGENAGQPLTWEEFLELYETALEDALASAGDLAQEIVANQFSWSVAVAQDKIYQQRLEELGETFFLYETIHMDTGERYDALIIKPGQEDEESVISHVLVEDTFYAGRIELTGANGEYSVWDYEWDLADRSSIGIPVGSIYGTEDGGSWGITVERNEDGGVDHWIELDHEGEYTWMIITTAEQESTVEAPDSPPVDLSGYSWEELQKLFSMIGNGMMGDEYY